MMMSVSGKTAWGIGAAISGILVVGYCIYFDHQRRNDPNFRKNLREKRKQRRLAKTSGTRIPDLRDQEAVQKFFLSEVQLGEDLLSQGDVDGAVEHLGSAIAVCGHPQQLLQILQQTLPPQVFHLLLQRLPMIGQAVHARQLASYGAPVSDGGNAGPMGGFGGSAISIGNDNVPSTITVVEDELE